MSEVKSKGRVQAYDPGFVTDVSLQVLIEFYNNRQSTLRAQIDRDPEYISKLRTKARSIDPESTAWLVALDLVPTSHKDYRREVAFRKWCLRLEPPMPPAALKLAGAAREAELRDIINRHFTDEYWRINCKRYIDAIVRVRTDKCLALVEPEWPTIYEDNGDEFL